MIKLPYEDDYKAIQAWLEIPREDRAPLPAKRQELWERWNCADDLMRVHMVEHKVIDRLMEKYAYSKTSAERDVRMAKKFWGFTAPEDKEYLKKMFTDYLIDMMVKAGKKDKFDSVAKLSKEVREWSGATKKDDTPVDPLALKTPQLIQPVFLPALLGAAPISDVDRRELFEKLMREKRDKGFVSDSTLAQFSETNDGADPGGAGDD